MLVAACGGAVATGSPAPTATAPAGTASASAPAGSGAPPPSDTAVQPSPSSWPGDIVEGVMNLGKADAQIQAAGADLGAAAAYEDLEAMWGAADGLATLLERLIPQVDRIRDYPATADAAKAYDASLPVMLAGAQKVRDSITSGDAAGLTAGSEQLAQGLQAYAQARQLIGPLVDQAILMQRLLAK
jgi:hypothetical protein